jgi:hypothetical protein
MFLRSRRAAIVSNRALVDAIAKIYCGWPPNPKSGKPILSNLDGAKNPLGSLGLVETILLIFASPATGMTAIFRRLNPPPRPRTDRPT